MGTRTKKKSLVNVAKSQYLDAWYQSLTSSLVFLVKKFERTRCFRGLAPQRQTIEGAGHGRIGMCFFVSWERVLPS